MSEEDTNSRDLLKQALELHLREQNGMPPEEELGDFIIVACGVAIDKHMEPTARYYTVLKDGTMLPHVARGLLSKGDDVLLDTEVAAEDDDDA